MNLNLVLTEEMTRNDNDDDDDDGEKTIMRTVWTLAFSSRHPHLVVVPFVLGQNYSTFNDPCLNVF